ncbi:type II toxin-antitoxin system MqsA family antitoxin [Anaerobaca lacustris]|uniref:Type II toxin-antitoxin system MqsA family antitoxin n=1 Tax=Anaerobaca lacustris TaxID=3044600 RepID=A0AAW6TXU8_9BACT|nr:type II toxin-antitoxin system MqsA family antitoxin [Sedimentisphaerales bacterium M17dextr]
MDTLQITVCPSCGSTEVVKVCRDWSGEYEGWPYTVRSLESYECPACGEKIYDRQAMRKIQQHSPAFSHAQAR